MGAPWPFGDSRYHLSLARAYRSAGERRWGRTGQADFMFFSWWASVGIHGFLEDFACHQLVFDICDASFSFTVSFLKHTLHQRISPWPPHLCKTCEHMSPPQGLGSASGLAIEGRTSEAWQVGGCWTASHESHESHETCFARKVNPADVVGQLERRGLSTRVASSAIMTSLKSIWNHWNSQKEQWSKSHTSFLEKVDIHPPEW